MVVHVVLCMSFVCIMYTYRRESVLGVYLSLCSMMHDHSCDKNTLIPFLSLSLSTSLSTDEGVQFAFAILGAEKSFICIAPTQQVPSLSSQAYSLLIFVVVPGV